MPRASAARPRANSRADKWPGRLRNYAYRAVRADRSTKGREIEGAGGGRPTSCDKTAEDGEFRARGAVLGRGLPREREINYWLCVSSEFNSRLIECE